MPKYYVIDHAEEDEYEDLSEALMDALEHAKGGEAVAVVQVVAVLPAL